MTGKATDSVIHVHDDMKIYRDVSQTKLSTIRETKDYRVVLTNVWLEVDI